ncbi:MAG: isoleucine--tRNA ligase [Nanoarchaeota archaeon]|nr:isoleucine--tRNA ligase [Nanoarchaeota archaeon]
MYDFKKVEEGILRFWKEKRIYEKLKKKNSKGKKFYFMDGPPYATGHIHMGTALNKVLKDVAMRSQRSMGKDVFDRAGYDTHGLPIENKVEKNLGFQKKEDIEKYGVKKFINECKNFATEFIDVMDKEFENLGVWMDFKNPYLTLTNEYIESIWDTFKKADEKGLLYLGKYPVHVCPHCETAVAYNEIEYTKQSDVSIYVKFKIKDSKNKYLIVWTTTPWTLPSNTGVMVNPKFEYVELEINGERWIIAKEKVKNLLEKVNKKYQTKSEFKGKELEGTEYENPLAKYLKLPNLKNAYRVILSERYVNLEDGTGLVHSAPGCGKEDFDAGRKAGLPVISIVNLDGKFTKEGGKYYGKRARVVDEEIINDLKNENSLVYKENYVHDYPVCWRCKSPLLMISVPQWFFRISKIHKNLMKSNEEVNWLPSYMKIRMKAWLEGISDWPISRNRYWGTPLPIWLCNKCDKKEVIGSVSELERKSRKKISEVHKPEIDEITWKCECGGEFKRVSEVLDVWFDSGVSSWAALGYPKNKRLFKKFWPADLNIEGKDQFRGWWNSQIILSEIRFGKKPFGNIVVHGMVLSIGKVKMSKSLGNIISPHEIIEKYGRDQLRYYFTKMSKGEDFSSFDEKEFRNLQNFFRILININNYVNQLEKGKIKIKIEDKWILSKFNSFLDDIQKSYEKFKFPEAVQKIEKFLVEDLSKTYIKIIRERENEVYEILNKIRNGLLVVLSPIMPFVTEKIWQELRKKGVVKEESVHLCDWPKADKKKINKILEKRMEDAFKIIERGLAERDKNKIGLRWPLQKITVFVKGINNYKILEDIIKNQLNVKDVKFESPASKGTELDIELDTEITEELEAEGYARELSRQIQDFRKKLGLQKKDLIELFIITDGEFREILETQKDFIKERTNSKKIEIISKGKETFKNKIAFSIKDKRGELAIIVTDR